MQGSLACTGPDERHKTERELSRAERDPVQCTLPHGAALWVTGILRNKQHIHQDTQDQERIVNTL